MEEDFEPLNIVIKDGYVTFNGLTLTELLKSRNPTTILELKSIGESLSKLSLNSEDDNPFSITRDRSIVNNEVFDNGTNMSHGSNINMVLKPNGDTTFFGNISTLKKNIIKFNGGPTECLPLLDEMGNILGYIPIYTVNE